jgi:hypothetical protein
LPFGAVSAVPAKRAINNGDTPQRVYRIRYIFSLDLASTCLGQQRGQRIYKSGPGVAHGAGSIRALRTPDEAGFGMKAGPP